MNKRKIEMTWDQVANWDTMRAVLHPSENSGIDKLAY